MWGHEDSDEVGPVMCCAARARRSKSPARWRYRVTKARYEPLRDPACKCYRDDMSIATKAGCGGRIPQGGALEGELVSFMIIHDSK